MGVLAAHKGDHKDAIYYFRQAMSSIGGGRESLQENIDLCDNVYWEPTIYNLGHSYRKCRQFSNALLCFNRCVNLCPEKYSAYSALAFTMHLIGDIDDAISYYHKALGLKPDDPFCTDMLSRAFHDQIATTTTQDIFRIGLPPTSKSTIDSQVLSTPNILVGHKKEDSEDMELDFDMSIAS
jgi:anaphase-promoting complex subunit 6